MPPQRNVRWPHARRNENIEEPPIQAKLESSNAPIVQPPQDDNLAQSVTPQVGFQGVECQDVADTSRVLRLNPSKLIGLKLKGVTRIWYNQWKKTKGEIALLVGWNLSRYALEMVADISSRISLFMSGESCFSNKKGKITMLIGEMDIPRLIIHVQKVQKDMLKDREEFHNKMANTTNHELSLAVWHKSSLATYYVVNVVSFIWENVVYLLVFLTSVDEWVNFLENA
ncbi:hypothetical protein H5410_037026 [Solanum commersonii]|uniref:Uncharacterized protein n=1 Tax=Solanum commersonii TaxID=4109 RepID=A0A9J5Y6W2_SOLCO|nr:hypothetical protein H5410_037026 [Solanum commersonii]